jgi:hypothetical protein
VYVAHFEWFLLEVLGHVGVAEVDRSDVVVHLGKTRPRKHQTGVTEHLIPITTTETKTALKGTSETVLIIFTFDTHARGDHTASTTALDHGTATNETAQLGHIGKIPIAITAERELLAINNNQTRHERNHRDRILPT